MANENLAYDLSLFEPREERPPRRKTMRVLPAPKSKRIGAAAAFRWAVVGLLAMVSLTALMMSHVQLTELGDEISTAKAKLNTAQSEQVRLNMLVESRMSLKNVEDYAVNKLGMQKIQSYQISYINLNNSDKVVVDGTAANTPTAMLKRLAVKFEEYFK